MTIKSPFVEVQLLGDTQYKPYGVARFRLGVHLDLEFGEIVNWPNYHLSLHEGGYCDLLANDRCVRLVSASLMHFLNERRSEGDRLQWLPVSVELDGELRNYFVLNFPTDIAPLNKETTQWIGDWYPRIPVIRKEIVGLHSIFGIHADGYTFVVSASIARALKKEFPKFCAFRSLSVA